MREGAKLRMNGLVIGNVVTHVFLRRVVDGGEPNKINLQRLEIVELANNSIEVAYAVAIRIFERCWPYLITNGRFPPVSRAL
jgi:hypothetical protein